MKKIFIDDQNIVIYLENLYNVEYKSFDFVTKREYAKEYITKCKTEIIARNISILYKKPEQSLKIVEYLIKLSKKVTSQS